MQQSLQRFVFACAMVVAMISVFRPVPAAAQSGHPDVPATTATDTIRTDAPSATDARLNTIYLPLVQYDRPEVVLGAYLNPEISPQYYGTVVDQFEALVGREHGIYHYYTHWDLGDFNIGHNIMFQQVVDRGALPMLSFMSVPGTGSNPAGCGNSTWNLNSILSGRHDAYLHTVARQVAAFGHDILFRWGHEMNLTEYSWAGSCNNRNTQAFIDAYRHIVDIFRAEGATNVQWVWAPNYQSWPLEPWNDYQNYYPGDEYVDWVSVIGYNWGASSPYSGREWDTFTMLFDEILRDMARRYPDKPIMISDYASVEDDGGDKAQWITDAFTDMTNYQNLRAVVWHHYDPPWYNNARFTVSSSNDALDAYRRAIQGPYFSSQAP